MTTFSTGLVGVEVTSVPWLGQLTVKSLIIVIVGFQNLEFLFVAWSGLLSWVQITVVENKGKLILTEIFPSVQKHDIFQY